MLKPATDLYNHTQTWSAGGSADSSGDPKIVTAGATEDGVEVTGETIDLGADLTRPMSGVLAVTGVTNLTAAKTLSIGAKIQESDDGSTWDTAEVLYAATVVKTGAAANGAAFQKAYPVKLKGRKQYVRFNITPTMSHTSTDTCVWAATLTGAGSQQLPAA